MTWMLREGQASAKGYAASSASTHLAAVVVGLRQRGSAMTRDDQAAARKALDGLAVRLLQEGERRGRGQAAAAEVPDLYRVVRACPDTLAGAWDKALILTGFMIVLGANRCTDAEARTVEAARFADASRRTLRRASMTPMGSQTATFRSESWHGSDVAAH
ncbi:hypothetical protein ABZT23_08310 [Streptomyces sp. NPDC005386]|uniref:hypothetical protein n=1 Tax=Streptomyces sp. NPDC005386 TaxID=3154562 RepID=UPI0033B3FE8E